MELSRSQTACSLECSDRSCRASLTFPARCERLRNVNLTPEVVGGCRVLAGQYFEASWLMFRINGFIIITQTELSGFKMAVYVGAIEGTYYWSVYIYIYVKGVLTTANLLRCSRWTATTTKNWRAPRSWFLGCLEHDLECLSPNMTYTYII